MGGFDDFDVDAGAEGLEVGDDELLVRGRAGCWECGLELCEAERGEDTRDIGVVAEVKVEGLVQGESDGVVVEGDVILAGDGCDGVVGQAGEDFLDVADADGAAGGGLEVVVAGEVKVDGVFEVEPFLVGEEGAPGRVAEGDGFVGAEGLGVVGV